MPGIMITNSKVRLRDKKIADARNDYRWQTDPELVRYDAAQLLTIAFPQYLSDYTFELCYLSSNRYNFAIETLDGKHIGNCTYYNVDQAKGEAELGIMIGDRGYWDIGYGTDAVTALLSYIFSQTSLERIYLKTLNWNNRAQKCFQKCGFRKYGHMAKDGFDFLLMEITCKQWQERQPLTEAKSDLIT